MDLIKLIVAKVEEVEASGKLDKIIEKNVIECVQGIVSDSFQWSGEAKKSIEAGLSGKLAIDLSRISLPRYQKIVSGIVENHINENSIKDLKTGIEESVRSVVGILDKKEWKLSEIIEKFIDGIDKAYDGGMDEQTGACSLHIEKRMMSTFIYFDAESGKEKYECKNKLFIFDGILSSAKIRGDPFTPLDTKSKHGFDGLMFRLYCNAVTIVIDEENCELDYYREDCD